MKKRILLIATDSFGYADFITKELVSQGWEVTFLNDRPTNGTLMKILIRKFKFLISYYLDKFYLNTIKNLGTFDQVLIIKGEAISSKVISAIRSKHLNGKIVLYYWDSISNFIGGLDKARSVDMTYSFDPDDCRKYGFKLLPLFYIKHKNQNKTNKTNPIWDLSFIGTAHTDRMDVISCIRRQLEGSMYVFIFFQSRLIYFYYKITRSSFKLFKNDELSLIPLDKKKTLEVFLNSKAILDIEHSKQSGLTIRTLEALSLGKKLITTNSTIKDYPFYDPNMIQIIDRKNPAIDRSFLHGEDSPNFSERMVEYEIANWVRTLTKVT